MMVVTYASAASAIRAAKNDGIKNPRVIERADGRFTAHDEKSPLFHAKKRAASKCKNPVKTVWDLCFSHPEAKRRDIVTMAIELGVSKNTAATQYQYWRTAEKASQKGGK